MKAIDYLTAELVADLEHHSEHIIDAPRQVCRRDSAGTLTLILFSPESRYVVEVGADTLRVTKDHETLFTGSNEIEDFETVRGLVLEACGFEWRYLWPKKSEVNRKVAA